MQAEDLPDLRKLGVLLFGDSVDFRFLKFFCEFALGQEPKPFTFTDTDWLKLQGHAFWLSYQLDLTVTFLHDLVYLW